MLNRKDQSSLNINIVSTLTQSKPAHIVVESIFTQKSSGDFFFIRHVYTIYYRIPPSLKLSLT